MYPAYGGEIEFLIFKNCLYRAYCISLYKQGFTGSFRFDTFNYSLH